jgi:predicted transcriptional regulator
MSTTIAYEQNLFIFKERMQLLRRRNKYDILALILSACRKQPRTQSWLVRHLGLSTSSAKKFVNFLRDAKLIEANKHQEQKTYATSAKGKKALKHYIALTAEYFSI